MTGRTRRRLAAGGLVSGVVLLALAGMVRTPAAGDGQIVLVPAAGLEEIAAGPAISVVACTPTPTGLRVTGRVRPVPDAPVVVAVTAGDPAGAGRAVGAGFAAAAGQADAVGEFALEVAWAGLDAQFGVLVGSQVRTGGRAVTGPTSRCPAPAGAAVP